MPTDERGVDVWHLPATEKDEAHEDYENVVQKVVFVWKKSVFVTSPSSLRHTSRVVLL